MNGTSAVAGVLAAAGTTYLTATTQPVAGINPGVALAGVVGSAITILLQRDLRTRETLAVAVCGVASAWYGAALVGRWIGMPEDVPHEFVGLLLGVAGIYIFRRVVDVLQDPGHVIVAWRSGRLMDLLKPTARADAPPTPRATRLAGEATDRGDVPPPPPLTRTGAMPMKRRRLLALDLVFAAMLAAGLAFAPAPPTLAERLADLERRVARVEAVAGVPAPTTRPATPVRVANVVELRAAIDAGARHLITRGLTITDVVDARGATIEMDVGGTAGWEALVTLAADGEIRNATLVAADRHAVFAAGRSMAVRNVAFAAGVNYCVLASRGRVEMTDCRATTFRGYFYWGDSGTDGAIERCVVDGGSTGESVVRISDARSLLIADSRLDNSRGGKAVLRGNAGGTFAAPGLVVRDSTLVGVVEPGPLKGWDGGTKLGIYAFRTGGKWQVEIPFSVDGGRGVNPRIVALGKLVAAQRAAGRTPLEIVRACAAALTPDELKAADRPDGLTDKDFELTLALRDAELSRTGAFRFDRVAIRGQLNLGARTSGRLVDSGIESPANLFTDSSEPAYPFPLTLALSDAERGAPPVLAFERCELQAAGWGIDLAAFPGVAFDRTTFNRKAIAR